MFRSSHLKTAVKSLRQARGRSALTMTGIVIGIVSVVTIVGIGEGIKHQVLQQVNQLGKNLVSVRPGHVNTNQSGGLAGDFSQLNNASGVGALSNVDLKAVQDTSNVAYAVPLAAVGGTPTNGSRHAGTVIATTADFPKIVNQGLAYGSFFGPDDDGQNFAVIGAHLAADLFDEQVPLGQSFAFHGQRFVVRGIFNEFSNAPLSYDTDFNNAIFIPFGTAQDITSQHSVIYEILAQPKGKGDSAPVITQLDSKLLQAHGGQKDFTVQKYDQAFGTTDAILTLFTRLIAGIAAISLLVGGIGIMDVMLVSVTERLHEIGIRKAVGATNRQILLQFMAEATVLSIGGGIIGVVLSYFIDLVLHIFTHLEPVIPWQVVVIAVGVSLVVGIVFGTAPAVKAARKDPIDALRNE
jgi:putative ABC transport system permease protein